ncbi:hypothetical protein TNCV_1071531 [Trichonephila clavipes]|nr:hypothetical protein TNCV_1071531 [Trichonephila clavipes]
MDSVCQVHEAMDSLCEVHEAMNSECKVHEAMDSVCQAHEAMDSVLPVPTSLNGIRYVELQAITSIRQCCSVIRMVMEFYSMVSVPVTNPCWLLAG